MFDYMKCCILDELNRRLTFSYDMHSYITRSSEVFHLPKGNIKRLGINTLRFDEIKLWNKFYFELLNKETNLTKSKLKTLLKHQRLVDHYLLLFVFKLLLQHQTLFLIFQNICAIEKAMKMF